MIQESVFAFGAFALAYAGVAGIVRWAGGRRLLDIPNERSSHASPTPRGGGLAIVLVTLAGLVVWQLASDSWSWAVLGTYLCGATLVAGISWLDDLRTLPIRIRLAMHMLAAGIAIIGLGYWQSITVPVLPPGYLGVLGLPLTFIWVVGITNAYNFMDGIDGIAGGTAVIAGFGWALFGLFTEHSLVALLGLLLATASLGFLCHNWHPARIFMGDVGSAFLGYSFAVLPLIAQPHDPSLSLAGLFFIWPFAFDAGFTLLRRLIRGENVFISHRSHLYQRLVISGLSHTWVTTLYIGLGLTGVLFALAWSFVGTTGAILVAILLPLLCVSLWLLVLAREHQISFSQIQRRLTSAAGMRTTRRQVLTVPQKLRNRHFLLLDILVFLCTPALALQLRTDDPDSFVRYKSSLFVATACFLVIKVAVLYGGELYRRYWRYAGVEDLLRIAVLSTAALVIQAAAFLLMLRPLGLVEAGLPTSLPILDGLLTILAVTATRSSVRWSTWLQHRSDRPAGSEKVIVAGAGEAGVMIVEEMKRNPQLGMTPVGFVDDESEKQRMRIRGVRVLGRCRDLADIAEANHAGTVIIAMPTASGRAIREIVGLCNRAAVQVKTVPGIYELLDGEVSVKQVRNIRIEDLLRRDPIHTDISAVAQLISGKSVLVTGGGGSIGSELCRQLLAFGPSKLIVLGHGENSIFEICNELEEMLRQRGSSRTGQTSNLPETEIVPAIADIRLLSRVSDVFAEHAPEVVFHAAAHKHVPLMEANPVEAVTNNILGTRNVVDAARVTGVESFVMISSDKAVNPTNVMGASKRVAELIVHQAAHATGRSFVTVRFGNVLGSRGSVMHTFRRQIERGGPVTVTDPDMVRYFMSIPEAVQLVLQAATLGIGGELFTLDMGEPVKIVDLARDMIKLAGLEPDRDIDIVFSGIRPGEKLYEELFLTGEEYGRTNCEKIFIAANASSLVPPSLNETLQRLEAVAACNDGTAIVSLLQTLIPEFRPSPHSSIRAYSGDSALSSAAHRASRASGLTRADQGLVSA